MLRLFQFTLHVCLYKRNNTVILIVVNYLSALVFLSSFPD
jgi:hypothetical protein